MRLATRNIHGQHTMTLVFMVEQWRKENKGYQRRVLEEIENARMLFSFYFKLFSFTSRCGRQLYYSPSRSESSCEPAKNIEWDETISLSHSPIPQYYWPIKRRNNSATNNGLWAGAAAVDDLKHCEDAANRLLMLIMTSLYSKQLSRWQIPHRRRPVDVINSRRKKRVISRHRRGGGGPVCELFQCAILPPSRIWKEFCNSLTYEDDDEVSSECARTWARLSTSCMWKNSVMMSATAAVCSFMRHF